MNINFNHLVENIQKNLNENKHTIFEQLKNKGFNDEHLNIDDEIVIREYFTELILKLKENNTNVDWSNCFKIIIDSSPH